MKALTKNKIIAEEKKFYKLKKETKIFPITENFKAMKVEWLYPKKNTFNDWIEASAHAGLVTWENYPFEEIKKMSFKQKKKKVLKLLKERPISVILEMPKFAFKINNVSRAMTHQIVRHRKMAFGQQSIRVVNPVNAPIRKPFDLTNKKLLNEYNLISYKVKELYLKLINSGIPREQARNILPIGTTTSIVVTSDLRALIEYFKSRTLDIAQAEHSYLVYLIAKEMQKKQPEFFNIILERVKILKKFMRKWKNV